MSKKIENALKEFSMVMYEPLKEEDIINLGVTRWAFIYHDKDLKEDGSSKENHFHYYIKIPNRKRISTLNNYFSKTRESNVLIQECKNMNSIIRYFIHKDNEEKFQYNKNDIISNFDITNCFEPCQDMQDVLIELTNKIINGDLENFVECVQFCISKGSLETITKNTFYINTLLRSK